MRHLTRTVAEYCARQGPNIRCNSVHPGFVQTPALNKGHAEIAKTAGMSPGHIYNLFENKDDIIAAIVEQDCVDLMSRIAELQQESDVMEKMLGEAERAIDESAQVADAALELEVLAEAGRNPRLAAVAHKTQALVHDKGMALVRQSLGPEADRLPPEEIRGRALMLATLFSGLTAMTVRHAELAQQAPAMAPVMRRMLRVLLSP